MIRPFGFTNTRLLWLVTTLQTGPLHHRSEQYIIWLLAIIFQHYINCHQMNCTTFTMVTRWGYYLFHPTVKECVKYWG